MFRGKDDTDKFGSLEEGGQNENEFDKKRPSRFRWLIVGLLAISLFLWGLKSNNMTFSDFVFKNELRNQEDVDGQPQHIKHQVAEAEPSSVAEQIETKLKIEPDYNPTFDSLDTDDLFGSLPIANQYAPEETRVAIVDCFTTKGPIKIVIHEAWAPLGAARFLELVESNFFTTQVAFFRAIRGWLVQFGISGDPEVTKQWRRRGNIKDDPHWLPKEDKKRFKRGMLSFAGNGANSRQTEMFFAYSDTNLGGALHEVPFGELMGPESFETLDKWYTGYGDIPAFGGHAPGQGKMYNKGLKYLKDPVDGFPLMDYITSCNITTPLISKHSKQNEVLKHDLNHAEQNREILNGGRSLALLDDDHPDRPPLLSLLRTPPSKITVLLIPSPVDPAGRLIRLKAAAESWVLALRNVRDVVIRILPAKPLDVSESPILRYEGFTSEEVLHIDDVHGDNAARLINAYREVFDQGADWLFAINDHTFLIPENLRCYLDNHNPDSSVWLGHKLQENGATGSSFVSGAAGYVLSRSLLRELLLSLDKNTCTGSKRERSQPGLMMAKCIRALNVQPEEVREALPLLHVYGPARHISSQVDKWWLDYRTNVKEETYQDNSCCAPNTISFHYCFGPEQYLLNNVVRFPEKYRNMTHRQRAEVWPDRKALGAYSYPLKDPNQQDKLWEFLLDQLKAQIPGNKKQLPVF